MSLKDFLAQSYGSKQTKEKTKKPKKSQTHKKSDELNQPTCRSIDIVDKTTVIPENTRKATNANQTGKTLWKNLETATVKPIHDAELNVKDNNKERMSSGAFAGLQTAEEMEQQMMEKEQLSLQQSTLLESNQDTVYRDQKGKVIQGYEEELKLQEEADLASKAQKEEELRKRNMGEVQLLKLGHKTDKNALLSSEDPMAKRNTLRGPKISLLGRILYDKNYPENRFGIAPGYRWDGVDRSNGFESKWFAKSHEVAEQNIRDQVENRDF
ncbi:unnamed protein product [Kluyveromyces dobzhanskii CBS 2104]|uniref:Pre-mRNA-splicing factor CWC26 n=1 Tax=Kluyveromyces dobzhanskii CBS 2104 TaxID=1427455 RepID=A0A0A8LDI4_9SACH|nr:unnamed protein product [Kluyveromyces dobzhanskii CBS 2104]